MVLMYLFLFQNPEKEKQQAKEEATDDRENKRQRKVTFEDDLTEQV